MSLNNEFLKSKSFICLFSDVSSIFKSFKICFFSYLKKNNYLESLKKEEAELTFKIKNIETKNSLLTDNLDLDYIEFLIRDKYLLGKKNETVYIIKNNDN